MVDIETLGTAPGSIILSIGAVRFGSKGLGDSFYEEISMRSCVDRGLTFDPDTLQWWLRQDEEARAVLNPAKPMGLDTALREFVGFVGEDTRVWGCGSDFDNSLIGQACRLCGIPPLPFWHNRCYRTLKALAPHIKQDRKGTYHNAHDDARTQAEHAIAICKALNLPL